jgi:cell division protein FtsL
MIKNVCTVLMTLAIPFFLFVSVWQTSRYTNLENEVRRLDKNQYEVIVLNKRLISGISVLSTPERIEKVALQDLKMRKAMPSEIMRIELKKGELGG